MLSQWPTLYHLEREREREREKERERGGRKRERERKGVGGGNSEVVVVTKISPSTRRVLTLLARALGPGTNLLLLDVTSLAT